MAATIGPVLAELRFATDLLDELGVAWVVVGGMAVSAQADPRFTRDVDLAIPVIDDTEAERLIFNLRGRGYQLSMTLNHENGRFSTARLMHGSEVAGNVMLDLLFASSGIERELVDAAELMPNIIEKPVKVARIGHLIALKTLARDDKRRPQDGVDLRALIRAADTEEISRAHEAVRLITERGYNRKRDLEALLNQAIDDAADSD